MSNANKSLNNFFKQNEFIGSFKTYRDIKNIIESSEQISNGIETKIKMSMVAELVQYKKGIYLKK